MIRELFHGKRKLASIPVAIVAFIFAWPVLIGALIARLVYKYIPFAKLKIVIIALLAVICLPVGYAWAAAFTAPTPAVQQNVSEDKKAEITEIPTSIPVSTATIIPSPTALPTSVPTAKPVIPTKVPTRIPTKYIAPTAKPTVYVTPQNTNPPANSAGGYTGGDKDCGDFSTHAEAQAFYIANGGPGSDPHRLDADHDGSACETLP